MELESTLQKLREIGLTESDISSEVTKKQHEHCDLITNADALYLVAKSHGLSVEKQKTTSLQALATAKYGRKVNFVARLQQASCPKKFKNAKGSGVLVQLTVSDETKQANVVLWNKDASNFLELKALKNDLLFFENLTVKSENPLELHSTMSTKVEIAGDMGVKFEDKIPKLAVNLTKLDALQNNSAEIDTSGVITSVTPLKEFEKSNGNENKKITVMRFLLKDETKTIPLVIWNDLCDFANRIKKGEEIYIENCAVRPNSYTGQTELHSTRNTHIVIKSPAKDLTPVLKISSITENTSCKLECTVEKLLELKTTNLCSKCKKAVKTQCQCGAEAKQVLIATAILKDETGQMQCAFFEKTAMQLLNINDYLPAAIDAVFEFKKQEVKNKKIYLKVNAKSNEFLGKVTLTCKELEKIKQTQEM